MKRARVILHIISDMSRVNRSGSHYVTAHSFLVSETDNRAVILWIRHADLIPRAVGGVNPYSLGKQDSRQQRGRTVTDPDLPEPWLYALINDSTHTAATLWDWQLNQWTYLHTSEEVSLLKGIVHPQLKIVIIYSISCGLVTMNRDWSSQMNLF